MKKTEQKWRKSHRKQRRHIEICHKSDVEMSEEHIMHTNTDTHHKLDYIAFYQLSKVAGDQETKHLKWCFTRRDDKWWNTNTAIVGSYAALTPSRNTAAQSRRRREKAEEKRNERDVKDSHWVTNQTSDRSSGKKINKGVLSHQGRLETLAVWTQPRQRKWTKCSRTFMSAQHLSFICSFKNSNVILFVGVASNIGKINLSPTLKLITQSILLFGSFDFVMAVIDKHAKCSTNHRKIWRKACTCVCTLSSWTMLQQNNPRKI